MLLTSKTRRFIAIFTMIIMLFGTFMPQFVTPVSAASKLGSIKLTTSSEIIDYGTFGTHIMTVKNADLPDDYGDDPTMFKTVFCIEPSKKCPPSGTYDIKKIYDEDDNVITKIMYYSPGQPGYNYAVNSFMQGNEAGWYGGYDNPDMQYALAHILLSWWNDNWSETSDAFKGVFDTMVDRAKLMKDNLPKLPDPPSNYYVYYINTGSSYQNVVGAFERDFAQVKVQKKSTNTNVTNNNSDYSRGNCYFAIIKDGKVIPSAGYDTPLKIAGNEYTLRTRGYGESTKIANGSTPYITLDPGTYKLKEVYVDPNNGYELNTEEVEFTLNAGDKKSIDFKNDPYTGKLVVYKDPDKTKWETQSPANYALKGAKYGLYKEEAEAKNAKESKAFMTADTVFVTENGKGRGKATFSDIPYGTYYLAEITPPDGYAIDPNLPTRVKIDKPGETTPYVYDSEDPGKNGEITVTKFSENPEYTNNNSYYDLTTAKYTLYKKANDAVVETKTITKDSAGNFTAVFKDVPIGEYYIKETEAGEGYELDINEYPVVIKDDNLRKTVKMGNYPVESNEPPETVDIKVIKKSSNEDISCDNPNYSLKGAEFTVKNTTINESWKLITDENGFAEKKDLPLGKYEVTEVTPPPGYLPNEGNETQVKVLEAGTNEWTATFENPAYNDPPEVMLYKADAETGKYLDAGELKEYYPQKGGSLAGAIFEVNFYAITEEDQPADKDYSKLTPARTWYLKTDEHGYANLRDKYLAEGYDSDEFYYSTDGKYVILPVGTVTMQEIVAPEGYNLNNKLFVERVEAANSKTAETYQEPVIEDHIVRGDFEFVKKDGRSDKMAGIPFLVTALEDGAGNAVDPATAEKHLVVTDENGEFKSLGSWQKHSSNTNALDAALNADGTLNEAKMDEILANAGDAGVGLWFGEEGITVSDNTGALPYGKYRLDELKCSKNEGKILVTGIEFRVSKDTSAEYGRDSNIVDLGTLVNDDEPAPEFDTTLRDADTNTVNLTHARKEMNLTDRIAYENVKPGKEYRIVGKLMDRDNQSPLLVDGKEVTVEKTFTARKEKGNIELEYSFDATGMAGVTAIAFVELYEGNILKGEHKDYEDMSQAIKFVDTKIDTNALVANTNTQYVYANGMVTVTDQVAYEDVMPGYSYVLKSILMDKATGEPIEINGDTVEMETAVNPNKVKGAVKVTFPEFDATGLEGKTLVVFQEMTWEGEVIAEHKDLDDADQQIHFPKIVTKALDSEIKDHISYADDEVTIIDTVTYTNVAPGVETKVTGQLLEKESKKVIAERTVTFTPDSADGEVEVPFIFKGKDYEGKDVVIFESMEFYGFLMATHQDINDAEQTVALPKVRTKALGNDAEINIINPATQSVVKDTVEYTNLLEGREYTVKGKLMSKATGAALLVDGKEVLAEKTFTADKADGTIELEFTFDSTGLDNTDLVVFEEIYMDAHLVGSHKDIDDEEQTIHVSEVKTKALEDGSNINVIDDKDGVVVVDTVEYKNLVPGVEYTIEGTLIEKATGEPLKDGLFKTVKTEKTFTPESKNGELKMEFPAFDATELSNSDLVVFEVIKYKGKVVANHEDITDEKQTLHISDVQTKALEDGALINVVEPKKETNIIDTVEYFNLVPGVEYKVSGKLMSKETGEALVVDGKAIEAEMTFTPEEKNGVIKLAFPTFDSTGLENTDLVAFEELYFESTIVGSHKDIDDEEQTVHVSKVRTKAMEPDSTVNVVEPKEDLVIVDTVKYENLLPGLEYTIKSVLFDKATNEPVLVGEDKVTVEQKFTPDSKDGEIEVEFAFNATTLENKDLVAMEEIFFETQLVASHKDINDEEQTIHVSEVRTKALENGSNINVIDDKEEVVITDTVEYKNLVPGVEYKLSGTLMAKETGEALEIDGKTVTAEKTFTPEEKDGTIELEFPAFNATELSNSDLVVFENISVKDHIVGRHEDIDDEKQTLHISDVKTKAMEDGALINVLEPKKETNITDTVEYFNLVPGVEYEAKGVLMNKATGEALTVDGKTIEAAVKFTPEGKDGVIELKFPTFDSSELDGIDLVAFEELYFDKTVVGSHKDIDDEAQTIHVSKVRTTALEKGSTVNVVEPKKDVVIVDTVEYENLLPGLEYTLRGVLVDAEGEMVVIDDVEVKAEKTFTPEEKNGVVELEFPAFNTSEYSNKDFVVMEELYYETQLVGSHKDINDDKQTIHVSEVATAAFEDGSKVNVIEDKEAVIVKDKVDYKNLTPGVEYTISGTLMDKATGKPLVVDGKTVETEIKFTPEEKDGFVIMEFPAFNGTALGNTDYVAFETISVDGHIVGRHQDIEDETQTVHISKVETQATEKGNAVNVVEPKADVVIVDTADYYNLVPGLEYEMTATLMDKETGKAVVANGKEVVAKTKFTPEAKDGTVEITFDAFDATEYADKDLVVFEAISFMGKDVASHKDINDEAQTLHVSKLETEAVVTNTGEKEVQPSNDIVIADTIKYSNLIPGKEYTVKGVLMNKEADKPLYINGQKVEAEMTFTPDAASGEVVMTFPAFDGSKLENFDIVVFEYMYHENVCIASHADINDDAQTVTVTEIPAPVKTGDTPQLMIMMAMLIMTMAAVAAVFVVRRRRYNN